MINLRKTELHATSRKTLPEYPAYSPSPSLPEYNNVFLQTRLTVTLLRQWSKNCVIDILDWWNLSIPTTARETVEFFKVSCRTAAVIINFARFSMTEICVWPNLRFQNYLSSFDGKGAHVIPRSFFLGRKICENNRMKKLTWFVSPDILSTDFIYNANLMNNNTLIMS